MKSNLSIYGMKRTILCLLLFYLSNMSLKAQSSPINYMNFEPPPVDSLVIFSPGVVSKAGAWEEKICFTADGKELFFSDHGDANKQYFTPKLMHAVFENGKWSEPKPYKPWQDKILGWPYISGDGNTMIVDEVLNTDGSMARFLMSKRTENGWSTPKPIDTQVKSEQGFGLGHITNDSTFYFQDRVKRVAYSSKFKDGKWSKPEPLSYMINPCVEYCVSPKNDYIIFKPLDNWNQYYISFKDENDEWKLPIPLKKYFKSDKAFNTTKGYGPYISPDEYEGSMFSVFETPSRCCALIPSKDIKWSLKLVSPSRSFAC